MSSASTAVDLQSRRDRVTESNAVSMHDLLDRAGPAPVAGEPVPLLWHWLAFLPRSPQANLGPDGHPSTTGLLPPIPGRRRMFAGGRIGTSGAPLRIEHQLNRHSTASPVTTKTGRSGPLTFLTIDHALDDGGEARLWESNDLVYRMPTAAASGPATAMPAMSSETSEPDRGWTWHREQRIDEALLFRFSALTYNAHRIHYDRRYATEVEGYPGLVVHGPLQAVLLADLLSRFAPHLLIEEFTFRSMAPAFDEGQLQLRGRIDPNDGSAVLAVYDTHGVPTMRATATFQDQSQ